MSSQEHHHHEPEDPMVTFKVGIFFIAVVATIFLLALFN